MISKRASKISSQHNFEDKLQSDRPNIHVVPQIPKMNNAFSHRNELTIVSSIDNNSNLKSSSQLLSIKSKSRKENNHDNKSVKSSLFSSLNLNDNEFKSVNSLPNSKLFNYMPNANASSPSKFSRASFNDNLYKHKLKEIFSPTIYYSLNQMPLYESPLSARRRSLYSSKSKEENKKRQNKIIKRNLYLFETTNKKQLKLLTKRKSLMPVDINFTNKKNEIFKDAAFFEEGTQNKKGKKTVIKVILEIKRNFNEYAKKIKTMLIFEMFKEESKLILDFIFLFILAFYYIWVPITLAFIDTWEFNEDIIFDCMMISYILMFLRFFFEVKIYYKEQIESINKKNIFKSLKYFKISFFFDAIAFIFLGIFCFFPIFFSKTLWGIGFLVLKSPEFLKNIKIIRKKIALKKKFHFFFSVFIIWFRVFLISNFSACVWIYLGFNYKEQNNNWLINIQNILEMPLANWLIYWRCLTINFSNFVILGLGFSNEFIKPVTSVELFLIFITSSFGFIFLCYNLKCFNKLFKKLGQKHKRNVREFEGMLKNNGLKYSERRKFTKELSTVLKEHKEQKQFADSLKIISPNLQEELLLKIYWPIIEKIPALSKNFSKEFLLKLLQKIEIVTMAPNQEIFHENEYGKECIYYILSGEVGCYIQKRGSQNKNLWIQKIKKDFSFREISFFSNRPDSFSAKCLTYTNLLRINLCDFLDLLKDFPQDYEVYHFIKEKINSYYNLNPLFLFCESCSKPNHNFLNCPYITFDKRRCFLNAHLMTSQTSMKRCICFRRRRQIKNSLKNLPEIRSKALMFQKKNQEEILNFVMQCDLKSEIHENSDSNEYSDSLDNSAYTSFTKMPKNNPNSNINNNINNNSNNNTANINNNNVNDNNSNKIINVNNGNDGLIANPPSIFLQASTKKSRHSFTETIFKEDEEDNGSPLLKKQKSEDLNSDKKEIINKINNSSEEEIDQFDNSDEEEEEDEDEDEDDDEEEPIEKAYKLKTISYKDETSRIISPFSNIYSHSNMANPKENVNKSYRKSFSERINSEKDTSVLLRNLDKLNKINNNDSKSSNGLNNLLQSKSTFKSSASSFKKNYFTNTLSNNSFMKSRTGVSGVHIRKKKNAKNSSSTINSNNISYTQKKSQNANKSKNTSLFEFNFDKPKEFQTFFPHNNITKVVRETNIDSILKLNKPTKKIKNN